MKVYPILLLIIFIGLSFTNCSSKEKNKPGEPVFGVYKLKMQWKMTIALQQDSTAIMDINDPVLQKKMGIPPVHKEGVFTFRNDSIYITWNDGKFIKSKFQRKKDKYSFLNGSTSYERKL